jgi:hypothetical protein
VLWRAFLEFFAGVRVSGPPTLRRRIHCAIDGFKSDIWIQLKPPRKDATVNHNSLQKGWRSVEALNRKLIRPSLNEIKEQITPPRRAAAAQKKPVPPDQTNAENFYYVKQMIEWYDKCCLKVNRSEGPNLLLYKPCIKYMYKES